MAQLSEDKVNHMLGVARLCYALALNKYKQSEQFCKKMWLIGYCHDIGYEFVRDLMPDTNRHASVAEDIIWSTFGGSSKAALAISEHGKKTSQDYLELRILNEADLLVDGTGRMITIEERLQDLRVRYGEQSPEYRNSSWLAQELGLLMED